MNPFSFRVVGTIYLYTTESTFANIRIRFFAEKLGYRHDSNALELQMMDPLISTRFSEQLRPATCQFAFHAPNAETSAQLLLRRSLRCFTISPLHIIAC